jgi:hypothetical protein
MVLPGLNNKVRAGIDTVCVGCAPVVPIRKTSPKIPYMVAMNIPLRTAVLLMLPVLLQCLMLVFLTMIP